MVEEIRKELNFTSLRFNRLDDMLESVGIDKCKLCTYCWDGKEQGKIIQKKSKKFKIALDNKKTEC